MSLLDWVHLLLYQLSLSLLAVGGAVTLAPDLHRFLVQGQGWLSEAQFSASITLAQAAPGPNMLFVALLGWNLGLNAAGPGAGTAWSLALAALGVAVCTVGILAPSSLLTLLATRWGHRNRERLSVRAFRQGMAPIVVGVLLSTAWLLGRASGDWSRDARLWGLSAVVTLLVWRTRIHLLWLLAGGALLGGLGWV
ncbi:chromate transporter [Azohydromonas caseinilytica]|uniref:Chromate transporter n=1 Tax=Azohydromonas caseinilytica TaxID=2728836 RepID=A0A848FJ39_9BURK|nr:chromate transporter [Azohydromonas caseinilytica]NML18253.1 chromate transporter [Azohydromonas caseinilytica]